MQDHGHPNADKYALVYLHIESELLRERLDVEMASQMTLLRLAVGGLLSNEAAKEFDKLVKDRMEQFDK